MAFLTRHGFTCFEDPMLFQERRLDAPIPDISVPEAYSVVAMRTDTQDFSVTGNAPFPRDAYLAMRRAPGYRRTWM